MKTDGFTLIEIIIVIVILGMMATLALPRYFAQQETAIFSEGVSAAQMYYSAQQRYFLDKGVFSSDCDQLDLTLAPTNFGIVCNDINPLIELVRNPVAASPYEITVDYVSAANTTQYQCIGSGCTSSLSRLLPNKGLAF